jgi:LDH2 family malate/lactate/ureidoglycolate dehydrogenase
MATPTVPLGRIEVYLREGREVPLGWGVDKHGTPTTDPAAILFGGGLSPLGGSEETGGYKVRRCVRTSLTPSSSSSFPTLHSLTYPQGYGLSLMVEMMCGIFGGAAFGPNVGQACNPNALTRSDPVNLGQCFIAVDADRVSPGYAARMQQMVDQLHALPTAEGSKGPVLVPGEPESQATHKHMREGVPLHRNICSSLVRLAAKVGITVPSEFEGVDASLGKMAPHKAAEEEDKSYW